MRIDESGQNPSVLANLDEAVPRQVAADPAQQLLRGSRIRSFEMGDEAFVVDACQVERRSAYACYALSRQGKRGENERTDKRVLSNKQSSIDPGGHDGASEQERYLLCVHRLCTGHTVRQSKWVAKDERSAARPRVSLLGHVIGFQLRAGRRSHRTIAPRTSDERRLKPYVRFTSSFLRSHFVRTEALRSSDDAQQVTTCTRRGISQIVRPPPSASSIHESLAQHVQL